MKTKPQAYSRKPTVVKAMQYYGGNIRDVLCWVNSYGEPIASIYGDRTNVQLLLNTGSGNVPVNICHYVIRNADGEFYTCPHDVFERDYEQIEVA